MLAITVPGVCTDTSLPFFVRDRLLSGDNGGVRFLYDLAYPYSYVGGAPAADAPIRDISGKGDGAFRLASGQTIPFNGNGFDFSGQTVSGSLLEVPTSVAANIWGDGSVDQFFMHAVYMRLPTSADWHAGTGLSAFSAFTTTAGGYTTPETDLLTLAFNAAPNRWITSRRQTNNTVADALAIVPAAGDFGQVAQVAFWRNAAGQGLRLKTATNIVQATAAVGVNNNVSFAAKKGQIGMTPSFFTNVGSAHNWRIYRGFVENLRISGRDPVTVLDADWARVVARGVFS